MKNTGLIALGAVLVIGGIAVARRLKTEDIEKIKEFVRKKLACSTDLAVQNLTNDKN